MRVVGKRTVCRQNKQLTVSRAERGDASTEFVMVSALLVLLTVAILQVSYSFYVRNLLLDAASAGARYGVLYDSTPERGAHRTAEIIQGSLPDNYAQNISYREGTDGSGAHVLEMTVTAPLPVFGPFGMPDSLTVKAHAVYPHQQQ